MEADVLHRLCAHPGFERPIAALAGRADVWLVGGAVRDALLDRVPRDLDVVVDGDARAVAVALGAIVAEHERFGTIDVRADGLDVGVAVARTETYAAPGALPDVRRGTLAEDLRRRDFTVNAIAVDGNGILHGVERWADDLEAGRLRVLHQRSFVDDPTRVWRAARYAARLGFELEAGTERLARAAVSGGALRTVSGSRLGAELLLALDEPDPASVLAAAHALGLLPAGTRVRRRLVSEALALCGSDGHPGLLALAAMCRTVPGDRMRSWLDDLAVPARERDVVVAAATGAEALAARLAQARAPSEIAAAGRGRSCEEVALAGALGAPEAADAWLRTLRHARLEIGGDDLLAAGVPEGPELGRRLERALVARLDGHAPDRAGQLAAALAAEDRAR